MMAYELTHEPTAAEVRDGVRLLGLELTNQPGWPCLRHVFDIGDDAALHVEVGAFLMTAVYAVGFDAYGEELLTPL